MGRFFNGDIAEVLVYPYALNATTRAAVNAYLAAKWQLPHPPKDCTAPSSNEIVVAFGYGGFQEARGFVNVSPNFPSPIVGAQYQVPPSLQERH